MKCTAIVVAAALVFAALAVAPSRAQNARSFVSGHGSDANNCTLAAPCRTFAAAFAVTNPGGAIGALDPADYGTLTITRAISLVNDGGGSATVLAPATGNSIGITINAGVDDDVSLRGLTIEGTGAQRGVQFNTGRSLTIENCVIRNMGTYGIEFAPNATSQLNISSTLVDNSRYAAVYVYPSGSGRVRAILSRVLLYNGRTGGGLGHGLAVDGTNSTGTVQATVWDSVAAGNNTGFGSISKKNQAPATLMLFHSVAANNGSGVS
jgi:Right handed beta helix region